MASAFEQFQALRTGIADMTNSAPAYYVGETVEAAAVSLIAPKSLQSFLDGLRKSGALDIINKAYREKSSMRFPGHHRGRHRLPFPHGHAHQGP